VHRNLTSQHRPNPPGLGAGPSLYRAHYWHMYVGACFCHLPRPRHLTAYKLEVGDGKGRDSRWD
jgi:hypothetical protein